MVIIKRDKIKEIGIREIKSVEEYLPPLQVEPEVEPEKAEIEESEVVAKKRVSEIIAQATKEAEEIKAVTRKEGFEEGKKEAAGYIRESLEVLNEAIKGRDKIIEDAEGEILRLSLKIAESIIRNEVSLHRDVCMNIVADALTRVSDRESIIVKVNREDFEQIKKYKDRISGLLDGVKIFSILEDSQVEPGGCVIETNLGYVDARISTKLAAIEEAFKKEHGGKLT